jgi:hypothetical protein
MNGLPLAPPTFEPVAAAWAAWAAWISKEFHSLKINNVDVGQSPTSIAAWTFTARRVCAFRNSIRPDSPDVRRQLGCCWSASCIWVLS